MIKASHLFRMRIIHVLTNFLLDVPLMKSSFFAWISRLRWIKRWSLMRNSFDENVMEHSWEVATIAHTLALIHNRIFGGKVDANAVAVLALYHDVSEVMTSDMPTPVKYFSETIRDAYKTIEKQAGNELLNILPVELKADFSPLLNEDEMSPQHHRMVKAADTLSAYIKCRLEVSSGNNEFKTSGEKLEAKLIAIEMPEVGYFMQVFVPSYGQDLDHLFG